VKIDYTPHFDI